MAKPMMAKHMMAKQVCSNVSQLLCWPLQTPLGKLMAIMMGFIICWLRRRTLLRLQHLRQTQVSCQQCRAAVNVTYAMVCHSSDGRFYCKDCWQDVGVSSNHAKLIAYPPKTVYCAGCTEPSHRLLLPDLSQQLSPAATWTCDKCFDTTQKGGNRALLWFNLALSCGETENATKSGPLFYVTDFEFPTGGAPGLMKNHLVARLRSSSRRVLFVNHVDAMVGRGLIRKVCRGKVPKLVVWGSPHVNTLGTSKSCKQLDCSTNHQFKERPITG